MDLLLMLAFIVKHFVCDFPISVQTPWMFKNKGTYGHPGGIAHAYVHVTGSALILIPFARATHLLPPGVVLLLLFEWLVHYHMDWFKMWWNKRNGYTPATPQFWTWLGIDQMVHYLTYVVMTWIWL